MVALFLSLVAQVVAFLSIVGNPQLSESRKRKPKADNFARRWDWCGTWTLINYKASRVLHTGLLVPLAALVKSAHVSARPTSRKIHAAVRQRASAPRRRQVLRAASACRAHMVHGLMRAQIAACRAAGQVHAPVWQRAGATRR